MAFQPLSIQGGIVHRDRRARFLVSADYPYYRDDPAHWADRLGRLKALDIEVVSAYIPWRHHQPDPNEAPDFTGRTQANRDVLGFFALCQRMGLEVVAKPGPFIHAELNYGGLPDWACPLNDPRIERLVDSSGNGTYWSGSRLDRDGHIEGWPLPAPFCPVFVALARDWLTRVGEQVIRPLSAPAGPIVALQIANEGIFSNGQHAPWAYDYSPSGVALYRDFLCATYPTLDAYNAAHASEYDAWNEIPAPANKPAPNSAQRQQAWVDWGIFQADYMRQVFDLWTEPLQSDLPVILNQNPPLDEPFGLDAWLTRVEPERWPRMHYGFTNWVGDVSARPTAFDRYLLTAKRYPGVNMEENWGFAALYDAAYIDGATSFYQTLAVLNAGCTGFNVYTGVATAFPDPNIEIVPRLPYPDAAPITAHGEPTAKAEIVRWLTQFMNAHGEEFLACKPLQPVAWGINLTAARLGAWQSDSGTTHGQLLARFQAQMRALHLDYGVLNLHTASLEECLRFPVLVTAGTGPMDRAVQGMLAAYSQAGGKLILVGGVPRLNENFQPYEMLASNPGLYALAHDVMVEAWLARVERPHVEAGEVDVWVRAHPARDVQFVTLLAGAYSAPEVRLTLRAGPRTLRLEMTAAQAGGALLRLENGKITAAILKGVNDFLGCRVVPHIRLNNGDHDQQVGEAQAGDFAWIDGRTEFLPAGEQRVRS